MKKLVIVFGTVLVLMGSGIEEIKTVETAATPDTINQDDILDTDLPYEH